MKRLQKGLWTGLCLSALTSGVLAQVWEENRSDSQVVPDENNTGDVTVVTPSEPRPGGEGRGRGGFRNMSEEERAAFRERWNNMSEEERTAQRERRTNNMTEEERAAFRERRSRGEGGARGGEEGSGGAFAGPTGPTIPTAPTGSTGPTSPRGAGGGRTGMEGGGQRGPRGGGMAPLGGGGRQSVASPRSGSGGMRGTRSSGDVLRAVNVPERYQPLVTNSPFMSAEYRASLLNSMNAGRRELLFTGLSKPGGEWLFGLEERRQDRTYWMASGESDNGIEILQFDETERTLTVSIDGREFILRFSTQ